MYNWIFTAVIKCFNIVLIDGAVDTTISGDSKSLLFNKYYTLRISTSFLHYK